MKPFNLFTFNKTAILLSATALSLGISACSEDDNIIDEPQPLDPTAQLEVAGYVRSDDGEPLAGIRVIAKWFYSDDKYFADTTITTKSDGFFGFSREAGTVRTDRMQIVVDDLQGNYLSKTADVPLEFTEILYFGEHQWRYRAYVNRDVSVRLAPTAVGTIIEGYNGQGLYDASGIVLDAEGNPLKDIRIIAHKIPANIYSSTPGTVYWNDGEYLDRQPYTEPDTAYTWSDGTFFVHGVTESNTLYIVAEDPDLLHATTSANVRLTYYDFPDNVNTPDIYKATDITLRMNPIEQDQEEVPGHYYGLYVTATDTDGKPLEGIRIISTPAIDKLANAPADTAYTEADGHCKIQAKVCGDTLRVMANDPSGIYADDTLGIKLVEVDGVIATRDGKFNLLDLAGSANFCLKRKSADKP